MVDAHTIATVLIHSRRYQLMLDRVTDLMKTGYHELRKKLDEEAENFVDAYLREMVINAPEDGELMRLIKGSEEQQQKYLSELRKSLKLEKAEEEPSEPLEKAQPKPKIPSMREMWNKKTERLGGYVHYGDGKTLEKQDKYAGLSDSERRMVQKRESDEALRKRREDLAKSIKEPQTLQETMEARPDKVAALKVDLVEAGIQKGLTFREANLKAEEIIKAKLRTQPDLLKGSKLPSAESLFKEMMKKKKHWTESE